MCGLDYQDRCPDAKGEMQNGAIWRRCKHSLDLTVLLLAEGTGRNVADLVTVHTDVGERVVRQVGQFRNRAAIVDPIGYDTERVHDIFLFRLLSAPACAALQT